MQNKKVVSLLIVLLLTLSLCLVACGEKSVVSTSGLEFELNEDGLGYTLVGLGTCSQPDIVVGTYLGLPVTAIGENAFVNECIQSVTLSKRVKYIAENAFDGCSEIENVYFNGTLDEWLDITYGNAYSAPMCSASNAKLHINGNLLTSVTLDTERVPDSAFAGCASLTSVTFTQNVKEIGASAFSACSNLGNFTLPNSLVEIDKSAFSGCTSITSVTIPNSVTTLGAYAFTYCTNLESVTIGTGIRYIDEGTFRSCTKLVDIDLANVQHVYDLAFDRCDALESISFPDGITLSTFSFNGQNLKSLVIGPDSIFNCYITYDATIYFRGTATEWKKVSDASYFNQLNITVYLYSQTTPTTDGQYWHYVDNVPTAW